MTAADQIALLRDALQAARTKFISEYCNSNQHEPSTEEMVIYECGYRAALAATAAPAEPMIDGYPLYSGIPQPEQTAEPVSRDHLLGAIARGWCSEKNKHKEMDADLAFAICDEIQKYSQFAQQSNAPALSDEQIEEAFDICRSLVTWADDNFDADEELYFIKRARDILAAQGGKP